MTPIPTPWVVDLIQEALANASDNGYGFIISHLTDEQLATDLRDYDAYIENTLTYEDVLAAVRFLRSQTKAPIP